MSDVSVRVENLGKKYHIGARQKRYRTLRDALAHHAVAPFRRAKKLLSGQATGAAELDEVIWALRGLSFEVRRGEVVGVIGHNGAGKTTLLKILSRITEPTEGYVELAGRVGSLLEVGTGFHRELTGRENIYLNGAVLGMARSEIDDKFDEIVQFAETGKFVDTPVKHYSDGMRVRLAFAVAAHLEPEILLVDEVLSVGDAAFQRKCLGKMDEVAEGGRTVLFVSHNMGAVTRLCERVILLKRGRIVETGAPRDMISTYLTESVTTSGEWERPELAGPRADVEVESARLRLPGGEVAGIVPFDQRFELAIRYRVYETVPNLAVLCRVHNVEGVTLWTSWDTDTTGWEGRSREPGWYRSVCKIPAGLLRPGRYFLSIRLQEPPFRLIESHDQALSFEVSSVGWPLNSGRLGVVTPLLEWEIDEDGTGATSERASAG